MSAFLQLFQREATEKQNKKIRLSTKRQDKTRQEPNLMCQLKSTSSWQAGHPSTVTSVKGLYKLWAGRALHGLPHKDRLTSTANLPTNHAAPSLHSLPAALHGYHYCHVQER